MTAKEQEQSAPFRLIACAALVLSSLFGATSSMAADNHFRVNAPFAPPATEIGGETRIPAARPAASGSARSDYGRDNYGMAQNAENGEEPGRLRLRPMNFGGM
jgi:hypothetical protein